MSRKGAQPEYVICVSNEGYPASLECRKVYQTLPDPQSAAHNLMRVIDESGEDYLYPTDYFAPITLSKALAKRAFALAA